VREPVVQTCLQVVQLTLGRPDQDRPEGLQILVGRIAGAGARGVPTRGINRAIGHTLLLVAFGWRLVREPHGHLGEQCRQSDAVSLVATEISRLPAQARKHGVDLVANVVGELPVHLEDLLAELALGAGELVVEQADLLVESSRRRLHLARNAGSGFLPFVVLCLDALKQGLGFDPRELLEGGEPPPQVFFEIGRFARESLLDPCESPIEIPHLTSEEDVPNFVQTGGAGFVTGGWPDLALLGVVCDWLLLADDRSHGVVLS
jgi:hypothetical protein